MSCPRYKTWLHQKQRHPQTLGLLTLSTRSIKLRQGWLVYRPVTEVAVVWAMKMMMTLFKAHQMSMTTSSAWKAVCEECTRWKPTRRRKKSCSWAERVRLLQCQLRTPDTRDLVLHRSRTAQVSNASRHCVIASRSMILGRVWEDRLPARQPPQPRPRVLTAA